MTFGCRARRILFRRFLIFNDMFLKQIIAEVGYNDVQNISNV